MENEQHQLIDIGYCGLHIIHGAFKTSAENTNCEWKKVLQETFILLHDLPTGRGDYVSLTGSITFSLSFWAKRWIKEIKVADLLINVRENAIKISKYWGNFPKSKQSSFKSFLNVQSAVNDQVSVAKFQFFSFIANLFGTFLIVYQTDWNLLTFMSMKHN